MRELIYKLQLAARQCNNEGTAHLFDSFSKEIERFEVAYNKLHERLKAVNSEREQSIENLQKRDEQSSLLLEAVLKNAKEGIIFIDQERKIKMANEAALNLLEMRREDIEEKDLFSLLGDNFFGFSVKEALASGAKQNSYSEILKTKRIESAAYPLRGGLLILFEDITEKEKLKNSIVHNERLQKLGELTATIAHEIRNPLGGIRGYASLLERDLKEFPNLQEMANNIIEGIRVLERLLSNLLQFSRPLEVHLEFVDVVLLLKEVTKFVRMDPSLPDRVALELHISESSLLIPIDKYLLKTALLNLIFNAFQSIEEEGKVTISLIRQNGTLSISISDTGKGIEPKDLENLFSPFFTTKKEGNGLGLAESYKIIKTHLGSISVHSEMGQGSTFTINLPLKR